MKKFFLLLFAFSVIQCTEAASAMPLDSLCDLLLFRDGREQSVRIQEISPNEVKYKFCNQANGALFIVPKSELFSITFADGHKELMPEKKQEPKKVEGFSLSSMLSSFFSLLFFPAAIPAVVLGFVGLSRIKKSPETRMGKGFAITGIVLGIVLLLIYAGMFLLPFIL